MTRRISDGRPTISQVFGTELPAESTDERDPDSGRDADYHEQWLRDNLPPHHS
jgi:hypothetical protein